MINMKTSTVVFGGFFMADNGERIQIPVLENPDIREINHFFPYQILRKKPASLFSESSPSRNLAIPN
ncbi:conserved hypothetical protein [Neisseria meningitidis 053442]|nr:conserved hypothetical protein [Neisseria meningitidis 053442]